MIRISCGYRIHINSIDMNGFNNRVCGGVGFLLDEPKISILLDERDSKDLYEGDIDDGLLSLVTEFRRRNGVHKNYFLKVEGNIFRNKGLGSTTTLKLCLLKGLCYLENLEINPVKAAEYGIGCTS